MAAMPLSSHSLGNDVLPPKNRNMAFSQSERSLYRNYFIIPVLSKLVFFYFPKSFFRIISSLEVD
jgi:hypothetical protein